MRWAGGVKFAPFPLLHWLNAPGVPGLGAGGGNLQRPFVFQWDNTQPPGRLSPALPLPVPGELEQPITVCEIRKGVCKVIGVLGCPSARATRADAVAVCASPPHPCPRQQKDRAHGAAPQGPLAPAPRSRSYVTAHSVGMKKSSYSGE